MRNVELRLIIGAWVHFGYSVIEIGNGTGHFEEKVEKGRGGRQICIKSGV